MLLFEYSLVLLLSREFNTKIEQLQAEDAHYRQVKLRMAEETLEIQRQQLELTRQQAAAKIKLATLKTAALEAKLGWGAP